MEGSFSRLLGTEPCRPNTNYHRDGQNSKKGEPIPESFAFETSPIKLIAGEKQYNAPHKCEGNNANSISMLLYLLPPEMKPCSH